MPLYVKDGYPLLHSSSEPGPGYTKIETVDEFLDEFAEGLCWPYSESEREAQCGPIHYTSK
jgi:hypothetical protein